MMVHEFAAAHIVRKPVRALLLLADRIDVTAEREATAVVKAYPWLTGRSRTLHRVEYPRP